MKNHDKPSLQKICLSLGIVLLAAACAMLIFWQWNIRSASKQAGEYVDSLRRLIPEVQGAVLEERRDNSMAVLSLDGSDFVGILDFPLYDSALPVAADWGSPTRYPRRLSGSIYDRSIQIGASSQAGQYDFFRDISVGDQLFFTDMEGKRFAYAVTDIRYEKHADQSALQQQDAALTLFIKNIYGFEYIVLYCDTLA
jgi:hypothetical protein